jgi:hypothetical protein
MKIKNLTLWLVIGVIAAAGVATIVSVLLLGANLLNSIVSPEAESLSKIVLL